MLKSAVLVLSVAALTTGCGSSSSSPPAATAPLTLSVTDAPIDDAVIDQVCIDFDRITVHYAGQPDVELDYDPLLSQVSAATHCDIGMTEWDGMLPVPPVRLDALAGPLTVALAESLQVPVGRITWIRLHFGGGSYVRENDGGRIDLRCPSCEATDNNDGRGFKLNRTFEVTSAGIAVTVDIDLRKSLHQDANGYVLRPTARIEIDASLGTIAGTVNETVIADAGGTTYTGTDLDTGCAVYIYSGHDFTPDDHYDGSPVISTARVRYDTASGLYRYAAGALVGGTVGEPELYTAALTCDGDDILVDSDPDIGVIFGASQNAEVVAGQTDLRDF